MIAADVCRAARASAGHMIYATFKAHYVDGRASRDIICVDFMHRAPPGQALRRRSPRRDARHEADARNRQFLDKMISIDEAFDVRFAMRRYHFEGRAARC